MKIFSAKQIKKWDQFTIQNEPVSAQNLMQRAAKSCVDWIQNRYRNNESFYIFFGPGNNGGDGLVIARLLYEKGFDVTVFYQKDLSLSDETKINFKKTKAISGISFFDFDEVNDFQFKTNAILLDCLFGTGLNRKLQGKFAQIVEALNILSYPKISIDIPSGLFADSLPEDNAIIFKADYTLSFQTWKKSFLHPETGKFCGVISILDINLSPEFLNIEASTDFLSDESLTAKIYRPRNDFSNKGTFGKTLIVAGSFGKIGAAILATKSALKSGSGITVTLAPNCGYEILQTSCPEAMFLSGGEKFINKIKVEDDFTIGIGPGLGTDPETEKELLRFLKSQKNPLVIDADALNILAKNPGNINDIPKSSIITPHPKEFERLFGKTENSFQRLELARKKAAEFKIFIVLKDHHTQIITPENKVFYNITGNSGMAKGGSGDALLGIITSLMAQNYSSKDAAIFGVWLHGKAGDFAAEKYSKESMLPSDLIDELGNVFKMMQ